MAEKRREDNEFARLLAEAGIHEGMERSESSSQNKEAVPIRTSDAVNLSVQGKKALSSGNEAKERVALPMPETERREDFQGNKIHISSTAKNFSRKMEENVAWETRTGCKRDN